ncbi:MAG: 5-methyltetrahydropteroyltriglutamate--homocysteine methyltransferase [Hydrogenibacillus schlegelii]|uniref:5-methyltetrahydropteroyltriglutamate--homocysteine methyltransferase n=1 Tax=Hydrogenibacillus schlegelii TaxID=1484 RepID=A0A2T5GF98_HYDSH|nr:5-methyltetrahydropteroyltriglutamate--homocysteine S-methyltransferase [Hydrogenibacillus schlegelii]PTQ54862.1 MAG: 5-methyltetrahydropteroyltriglutamate--homocysteine methyltransferase [Hydrogenibacillus schlegelii]
MIQTANLGYPRLGPRREWKRALERYWQGKLTETELHDAIRTVYRDALRRQAAFDLTWVPAGDLTYYDPMLDLAVTFGLVPARFREAYGYAGGPVSLELYFAIARGSDRVPAAEMTKWFNTNYHYIVPELDAVAAGRAPEIADNRPLQAYREAREVVGERARPVVVGPYTFVRLSKGYPEAAFAEVVRAFVPAYRALLRSLAEAGAAWIQIDEPALVLDVPAGDIALLHEVYGALVEAAAPAKLMLQTYFEAVEHYSDVVRLPVAGIGLDFVDGLADNRASVLRHGFPEDKVLGVGLIPGRNVWRADLEAQAAFLRELAAVVPFERMILSPSTSLLFVPISLERETKLDPALRDVLAFADEKLAELRLLARADAPDAEAEAAYRASAEARRRFFAAHPFPAPEAVTAEETTRTIPFEARKKIHAERFSLPLFPTTTIGSFPQTKDVREARARFRKGELDAEGYKAFIRAKIAEWIRIQEELGLDVLVHGEFERTDMVEYFAEKLGGFAFTEHGWVQSYGSRAVRPPIIYGEIVYREPLTVEETAYAQSLTEKPVKGMLTGPVTILKWSYPREDVPPEAIAYSIARALRKEVEALEAAGIRMVQVDEPAFREGLPLKRRHRDRYLDWAVRAFRLATAGARPETQVHTHMCYSEFGDIIDAIKALDADVISIETSRSHGELIQAFEENTYDKEIGLGVYDIHSPRVPDVEEMKALARRALRVLPKENFWINPDCGLKTRDVPETIASLKNMVAAARGLRAELGER